MWLWYLRFLAPFSFLPLPLPPGLSPSQALYPPIHPQRLFLKSLFHDLKGREGASGRNRKKKKRRRRKEEEEAEEEEEGEKEVVRKQSKRQVLQALCSGVGPDRLWGPAWRQ